MAPEPACMPACASQLTNGPPQSSGVKVAPECLEAFQTLKLGKKTKYIIYKLSDDLSQIVVAKTSDSPSFDDFLAELPAQDCRYAIYDFEFEKEGEGKRNKIIFFGWSPDEAKIKSKMVYASSKDAIRKGLVGISTEIQGTDFSEVSYETGKCHAPDVLSGATPVSTLQHVWRPGSCAVSE